MDKRLDREDVPLEAFSLSSFYYRSFFYSLSFLSSDYSYFSRLSLFRISSMSILEDLSFLVSEYS